ncbi:MAG: formylglycine-generating enzyme family protein [Polyangiaceae bacterium]|nr:formylglycine-generating enzyme family protein [Polyangiaceae bacterium]
MNRIARIAKLWIYGLGIAGSGMAGLGISCSASPSPTDTTAPSSETASAVSPDQVDSNVISDAAIDSDPDVVDVSKQEPVETGPQSCPSGMKLIDGDYCTEVDQKCAVEWFAPQNKKRVCEQFEQNTRCVGTKVHKRYCIDTYAWPNQAGVRPEVMNNFYQAQVKCAAVGKRMCTETEWTFACEGPEMKPFPYGYVRDPRKCNSDHKWDDPKMTKIAKRDPTELARLWRGVPSGSQPHCVSDFGVYDLPGNADEVVASEKTNAPFSSVHTGGPWYSGVRNQCRPKVYTHDEGFYYYYLGFRCCAEADDKPTDPLTPKQKRERMRWESVERLARFSVSQMQEKLEQKSKGNCTCRETDILCKTMCGTLLGPGAVDGDDSTRVFNVSRDRIK